MHQSIRESLEDYLNGSDIPEEFRTHLGECGECAAELRLLETQSQLLRSLAPSRDVEPRAGFYARVMERIESQPASIWSAFLDRKFGLRLALASAVLVTLLGTYLVTSEPSGPEFASAPAVVSTDLPSATGVGVRREERSQQAASIQPDDGQRQQQQRDALLVDLASYHQ
jgi:predicted anti-sigma-YlaC factor YlaD